MWVAAKLLVSSYGDWPILLLCQIDVTKSARHEPFVDGRIARMCQNLIDAPAGHYIATQKQLDFAQVQAPLRPIRIRHHDWACASAQYTQAAGLRLIKRTRHARGGDC